MTQTNYSEQTIGELFDGKLPWKNIKGMMSGFKDAGRFDLFVAALQKRVPWDERILLPLGPRLFIVRKEDGSIITKSWSGAEFGDYRQNWKLKARIFVRDSAERYREIYTEMAHADPEWMEMREFYDPLDGTLLDVEVVPPGYPLIHDFEPDLEGFYEDWLGRPLPA